MINQQIKSEQNSETKQEINKIEWKQPQRLYYPKTTAPNIALEEKPIFQNKYNADAVYEWNIDSMSEYNILNVLHQMTMVSNVYKTQSQISDHAIAYLLVAGFLGQLKGWWDNYLITNEQNEILKAIKKDKDNQPILDEQNNEIQDAVTSLIFSISKHFIGDPSHLKDKNSELFSNLKCKKLTDFKWYKDTFMIKIMQRTDNN